jgi:hypothetical protein
VAGLSNVLTERVLKVRPPLLEGLMRRRQFSTAPVHAKDEIDGVIAALAGNPGAGLIAMPGPNQHDKS